MLEDGFWLAVNQICICFGWTILLISLLHAHIFLWRSEEPNREQVWQSDAWSGAQPVHAEYSSDSVHPGGDGGDAKALFSRALQSASTG